MSKKIYVGNMSYSTNDTALNEIFATYGEVLSVKVIEDKFTGRSKGFAFVEMENDDAAIAAINGLNGKEIEGRALKVNEAFDGPKRSNNNRGGGDRGNFRRSNRY